MIQLKMTAEQVAYHEAGHIVVAFLTGYHVIDDAIDIHGLDGKVAAQISLRGDPDLWQKNWVGEEFPSESEHKSQRCFVAVAGYTAEAILASRRGEQFDEQQARYGAHHDLVVVYELVGPQFGAYINSLRSCLSSGLVWSLVERLANELLESKAPVSAQHAMALLEEWRVSSGISFRFWQL